jgi:methyl coenzyme M reductase subunit C-like uncharacterized protein (methanogenesis marker protein 7)
MCIHYVQNIVFSGGVYKYELLVEHVDDVGGLIIQEDVLHISRGTSFLADGLRVILIVPSNEFPASILLPVILKAM